MFHWENADAFIFPIVLPDEGSDKATPMLLGVQVARPYPHDELVELISGLLRRNRIAPAASAPRYADRKK
ncbi:hypothetical protein [Nitrososphaera sp.]|uniref:hypothetical protein n=1 Tax=Nitrososphaera sp. TaxID=1971748 RepID=UPI00307EEC94